MMTRAERRRMERESGSRTTYQFTLEQIEAMKRQAVLAILMSVPARILCEQFGWTGLRSENDHRSRLYRFSEAVVAEVNRICGDENADIWAYRDETYEMYGIKYEVK